MSSPSRHLTVCVTLLGFWLQAVLGNVAFQRSLCVGCEDGGWTISAPCGEAKEVGCCSGDHDSEAIDQSQTRLTEGEDCGCIDLPLPSDTILTVQSRAEQISEVAFYLPCVPAWKAPTFDIPAFGIARARAGPLLLTGLSTPISRRTVLVI